MTEWQPIETLPNGKHLITDGNDVYAIHSSFKDKTWIYWMPLPELPKKKHECRKDAWVCVEDRNEPGLILVSSCGNWIKVNECPICGQKA